MSLRANHYSVAQQDEPHYLSLPEDFQGTIARAVCHIIYSIQLYICGPRPVPYAKKLGQLTVLYRWNYGWKQYGVAIILGHQRFWECVIENIQDLRKSMKFDISCLVWGPFESTLPMRLHFCCSTMSCLVEGLFWQCLGPCMCACLCTHL
jgi:hypothetical protein